MLQKLEVKLPTSPGPSTTLGEPPRVLEMRYKYKPSDLEEIVTGYKNRKPGQYPDLDALKGDMGGKE